MPTVSVNLDVTQYIQVNTGLNPMVLQSHRDRVRITLSEAKPAKSNTVFHVLGGDDNPLTFSSLDTNVWALSTSENCTLVVSETDEIKVKLIGNDGDPIQSFDGGLDVHIADAHNRNVNEFFYEVTGTQTTVSTASTAQDRVITVASPTGFIADTSIDLADTTTQELTHPIILSVAGNDLTLDRPLDNAFGVGDTVTKIVLDMSVDGSATPVSYKLSPHIGETWHVLRFLIGMIHGSAADDSKFGNLPELTRGVLLRLYNGLTGEYSTYLNWKKNGDMKLDMYDVAYGDKAGGGAYSTSCRFSIKTATEAVPKVSEPNGDYLEILIQDNLSALTSFSIKAQGHVAGA